MANCTAEQIISPGELSSTPLFKRQNGMLSNLPPAVISVPPEHIRGYVHTKKVNHYLVGSNLGEGSFAKVKEAFHVLVGEKVGALNFCIEDGCVHLSKICHYTPV